MRHRPRPALRLVDQQMLESRHPVPLRRRVAEQAGELALVRPWLRSMIAPEDCRFQRRCSPSRASSRNLSYPTSSGNTSGNHDTPDFAADNLVAMKQTLSPVSLPAVSMRGRLQSEDRNAGPSDHQVVATDRVCGPTCSALHGGAIAP